MDVQHNDELLDEVVRLASHDYMSAPSNKRRFDGHYEVHDMA